MKLTKNEFAMLLQLDQTIQGYKGRIFSFPSHRLYGDKNVLPRMKKRGLVGCEGLAVNRSWHITRKGIDAYESRAAKMLLAKYRKQNRRKS